MSSHRIRLSRWLPGLKSGFALLVCALPALPLFGCASASPYDELGTMGPNIDGGSQLICSVTKQDCGQGSKCSTHDSRSSVCDVDGNADRGMSCVNTGNGSGPGGPDDCSAGNVCVVESDTLNQCRAFCASDADCGPGSYCYYLLGKGPFQLCTQPCSALLPATSGCQTGLACYVFGDEYTDCKTPGKVGANGQCISTFDCRPGYTCVATTGATGSCHQVCRFSNDCPSGTLCYDVQGSKGAWKTYGECH